VSLKVRLTAALVALLAAVTAVLGYAVVSVNRSAAIGAIDDRLAEYVQTPTLRDQVAPQQRRGLGRGVGEVTTVVYLWDARSGSWLSLVPDVESLLASPPVLPVPGSAEFAVLQREPGTVASADGGSDYRVRTRVDAFGQARAVASSLRDVQTTSRALARTVIVAGLLAVVVGALAFWWVISRALRPVDRMIGTAQAIAGGDLTQRVDHPDDGSELGRLGAALDEMLARLDADAQERELANRRLQQFVADASHELRTPVAAIRGYSELFRSGGVPDGEPTRAAMGRIESESVRMGTLIDDLLLLTRLDREPEIERKPVDVAALVDEAVAAYAVIRPDRPIQVRTEPAIVSGDGVRLRQVIDNLVGNALVHTSGSVPVRVAVERVDDRVRLIVSDDGPGIPLDQRAAVFERFTRLDASRTRSTGGSGLGLSIVAAVVKAHGGTVQLAESEAGGAEFVVELPTYQEPTADSAGDEATSAP
jgi:two-component system OmpR family sensor kinase